jgi:hypothetical protein
MDPFGETGRYDHPFGADLPEDRPPRGAAVKAGRQAIAKRRIGGLDQRETVARLPLKRGV